ncbi:hypothetical protein BDZ91DRAFT_797140 [Kalaharituber pfeilii]|nr:hypothetical protein BDZ91DRAFT_797140 [Kalaharituber pfeilii]
MKSRTEALDQQRSESFYGDLPQEGGVPSLWERQASNERPYYAEMPEAQKGESGFGLSTLGSRAKGRRVEGDEEGEEEQDGDDGRIAGTPIPTPTPPAPPPKAAKHNKPRRQDEAPPTPGFSPITCIWTEPEDPKPEALGFSAITTAYAVKPTSTYTAPAPEVTAQPEKAETKTTSEVTPKTRKRKGKTASVQDPYAWKRRLDNKEAKKIATSPPVGTPHADDTPVSTTKTSSSSPAPTPTPAPTPKTKPPHTPKPNPHLQPLPTPTPQRSTLPWRTAASGVT